MKNIYPTLSLLFLIQFGLRGQITDPKATEIWQPEVKLVTPGEGTKPPSDAIVLFDGKNLSEWLSLKDSTDAKWDLNADGSITVKPGAGNIFTRRSFGDCQLHIEFREPTVVKGESQGRGNSGVFLQSRYEVPIPMVKPAPFTSKVSRWQMPAASPVSGRLMTSCLPPQNLTWMAYCRLRAMLR
jgi:Domain of Unknown Function (DUF1080)